MSTSVAFVYSDEFMNYYFGEAHPFNPLRLKLTYELIKELGFFNDPNLSQVIPKEAKLDDIAKVHTIDYIDAVKSASQDASYDRMKYLNYNIGTGDNPIFSDMYDAAALLVGSTLTAAKTVYEQKADYAMNIGGGLHHSMKSAASGFCIFNDIAIAIKYLQAQERNLKILYLDVDVHHGDGVQSIFYEDPNVLCVSIHEDGRFQFPGSGFINERGKNDGFGYTINIPLLPNTSDEVYFDVFSSIIPKIFEYFQADYVFTQFGVDTHYTDPLGHFRLTTNIYSKIANALSSLASKYCNNKWIILGGGGYSLGLVPRAWTLVLAEILGTKLSDDLPKKWCDYFQKTTNKEAPTKLHDSEISTEDENKSYPVDLIEKLKTHVDFLVN